MDNKDELYNNLVTLLKFFKNRPYHLAKYLIDKSALSGGFVDNILKSDKLKEIQEELNTEEYNNKLPIYFPNISKMDEFYNSLSDISEKSNIEELTKELNEKMIILIKEEKYEDAAWLRDYMIENNIKRKL